MKLYYMPGACSLASHIVLREALMPVELVKVDGATKKTESGRDFLELNPLGYVPALEFDNGQILTEGPAIMQYVGDQAPTVGLVPSPISFERYRFQSWMNFIATEVHKGFGPLWMAMKSGSGSADAGPARERLGTRLALLDRHLADNEFLLGKEFSAVDAYLYTVLRWTDHFDLSLSEWPALEAFRKRVHGRSHVQAALEAEGLPT